jgi:hypothetical protein
MEKFAVRPYNGAYSEFEISALFWGALIAIALVAVFLVAWKAIGWLRDRKEFHGVTTPDPEGPWGRAISRPSDDYFYGGLEVGGLAGMNKREQEEIFSTYAPREVRKAMRERKRARELAQGQNKRPN